MYSLSLIHIYSIGNTLSIVTNDVDTISQTMNQSMGTLVSALATFVGALVMMFYTNWIMAVAAIVASLLGFALMMVIISRSQKYFLRDVYKRQAFLCCLCN